MICGLFGVWTTVVGEDPAAVFEELPDQDEDGADEDGVDDQEDEEDQDEEEEEGGGDQVLVSLQLLVVGGGVQEEEGSCHPTETETETAGVQAGGCQVVDGEGGGGAAPLNHHEP